MSASYLPAADAEPAVGQTTDKDPLYAALLGGDIGSALGSAKQDLSRDTLDEPVATTLVPSSFGPLFTWW